MSAINAIKYVSRRVGRKARFLDCFGKGRVSVADPADIFGGPAERHDGRYFVNKIASRWSDNMSAKNGVSFLVSQNLHETFSETGRFGTRVCTEREGPCLIFDARFL